MIDEQEIFLALCRMVEYALQSSDPTRHLLEKGAEAVEGVLRHDWVELYGGTVAVKLGWEHGNAVDGTAEVVWSSFADARDGLRYRRVCAEDNGKQSKDGERRGEKRRGIKVKAK